MTIITAFNESFRPCAEMCLSSISKHCTHRYAFEIIPDDFLPGYTLGPSWYKIPMIRRYLDFGPVLWVDSDTLMLRKSPEINPEGYLSLCEDQNGVNFGVMLWMPGKESETVLSALWDNRESFKEHPWAEQGAFHSFVRPDELDPSILPKPIWNAYEGEVTEETVIAHFPGMTLEERVEKMSKLIA